jgi:hypothetical protein
MPKSHGVLYLKRKESVQTRSSCSCRQGCIPCSPKPHPADCVPRLHAGIQPLRSAQRTDPTIRLTTCVDGERDGQRAMRNLLGRLDIDERCSVLLSAVLATGPGYRLQSQ